MTTRFNKVKLAEVQEKKAKDGLTGGLLTRKFQRESEPSKDDPIVTSFVDKSQDRPPASPTSSLELIISLGGGFKIKSTSKALIASFWENIGTSVQKDQDAISMEDLDTLMGKSPRELMLSHVHKLMQVCVLVPLSFFFFFLTPIYLFLQVLGESLYISGKYVNCERKLVETQSKTTSLSTKNKSLKSQVSALVDEAKKDKDRLTALEKSIDTEKAFSRLKDKQIDEALSKVEKASTEVVKFKVFNEYLDKLCDYYIEGFELFRKYMGKHHPKLDFSNLDMEAVENEVLADHQSTEGVGEGGEVVAISEVVNVDPSSSVLPQIIFFFFFFVR